MPANLNPPKQERSRRTLERIVRASLDILESEGPEGLTVKRIVAEADSSVGSFYARFEGKEDLLEYLGERAWTEAAERWDEAMAERDWAGLELGELMEGAVGLLVDAGRSRASYLRALKRAEASDAAFARFRRHVLTGIATLLLDREDEMGHPDPPLAVELGLRAVIGLLDQAHAGAWAAPDLEVLRREVALLLRSYLTPAAVESEAAGEVDFFDVWG